MPVITVTLLPGYPAETQHRLVQRLADTARSVIAASDAGTTVFINEASTYRRDGKVYAGGAAVVPDASARVQSFLETMAARKLGEAQAFLAPGFEMVFPGPAVMHRLEQLIEWGKPRYRSVAKRYERFDECWQGDTTVVYCSGTLFGVWNDGRAFEGIRFIDRFEVVNNLLTRQEVWNDVAEIQRTL
ncbi:hypothetical protein MCERE1_01758 [Burkholderiaceae bacterium]|jgi:phenylpyruvate tautomerase PptA (4-oxalocrotonate tautomerase family)